MNDRFDQQNARLEIELFDLESYINDIWAFSPVPLAYLNPQGIIMDADNSLLELLDYDKEELIGKKLLELTPQKEVLQKIEAENTEKGAVKNREIKLVNKSGREFPVNFSASIRKDAEGNMIGYFISVNDLSRIVSIQQELEEKMAELKEFNDLAVGRELKMVELEKEALRLKELLAKKR